MNIKELRELVHRYEEEAARVSNLTCILMRMRKLEPRVSLYIHFPPDGTYEGRSQEEITLSFSHAIEAVDRELSLARLTLATIEGMIQCGDES